VLAVVLGLHVHIFLVNKDKKIKGEAGKIPPSLCLKAHRSAIFQFKHCRQQAIKVCSIHSLSEINEEASLSSVSYLLCVLAAVELTAWTTAAAAVPLLLTCKTC
jgi:hypothetical protein